MNSKSLRRLTLVAILSCFIGAKAYQSWGNDLRHLIAYHDSGAYYQDVSNVIKEATHYLQFRLTQNARTDHPRKLAMVLDIDETALSNYHKLKKLNFTATPQQRLQIQINGNAPAIPYTLALYNYAKDHHVAVFFITGRPQASKEATVQSLNHAGYHHWDNIAFNPPCRSAAATLAYRIRMRQKIQKQGYEIVMNIGNRPETLRGGACDTTFKLPNPFYRR